MRVDGFFQSISESFFSTASQKRNGLRMMMFAGNLGSEKLDVQEISHDLAKLTWAFRMNRSK